MTGLAFTPIGNQLSITTIAMSNPHQPPIENQLSITIITMSDPPQPTVDQMRRWTPEQLNAYLDPRIHSPVWNELANLNPPVDGATFINHGGDVCYCRMRSGLAYALRLQVEAHGGPVNSPFADGDKRQLKPSGSGLALRDYYNHLKSKYPSLAYCKWYR
ncbi:hypothetical protein K440DRAFT_636707 [Wilcoxina mikolae CBS 423.85]|nr:hypothetical protein K440DRAFT_636707 [Wilcoxina mikolae CBS 423.85]